MLLLRTERYLWTSFTYVDQACMFHLLELSVAAANSDALFCDLWSQTCDLLSISVLCFQESLEGGPLSNKLERSQ